MDTSGGRKSNAGWLLIILVAVLIIAALLESSPFYYKNFLDGANGISSTNSSNYNADLRKALENGGTISFAYNYVPSTRTWETIYSYVLYRYGTSGDCTFYVTKFSSEAGDKDLCQCLYSEDIWNELLSLILDNGELEDCTSVYDSNGMVVSTSIEKTVSIAGGVYSPHNIDRIENYFKKLAVQAGVDLSELDNQRGNESYSLDGAEKFGTQCVFVDGASHPISENEKLLLEDYIYTKYGKTNMKMYILLSDSEDKNDLLLIADELLDNTSTPSVVFGLIASEQSYVFRYRIDSERISALPGSYSRIWEAYQSENTDYEKLLCAIDEAYALY